MKLNSSFWKMSSLKDLDGLYSLLKDCFCFFFFHDSWYKNRWGKCDKRRVSAFVPKKTPLNTHVFTSVFICAVRLIVMQFNNGLVNSKHAYPASSLGHLLGICLFFFGLKSCKCPTLGPGGSYKNNTKILWVRVIMERNPVTYLFQVLKKLFREIAIAI